MIWQAFGASVQGVSHVRFGIPCQDAHDCRILDMGAVAAVADGLGSAPRSEEGAKAAVTTALNALESRLAVELPSDANEWSRLLIDAVTAARAHLGELAAAANAPLGEFATTLIVAVVCPPWLAVAHIGDGAVVAMIDDKSLEAVSLPERGEYANEVLPLTAPCAIEGIRISVPTARTHAIAILSDGLQNLALDLTTGSPHAPFFAPLFAAVSSEIDRAEASARLADFLGSERVNSRTDDDKTLLVLGWR